ncbi:MAG TPA: secretin N-terminal domain-containing protein [Gammaproteobacteria bacterium]|nr:secretin N-terminal domain-containing protein [Gammaproteobacteria bacterium]
MKKLTGIIMMVFLMMYGNVGCALPLKNRMVAMDLQGVNVRDALQILAKQMGQSVVVSETVNGDVLLHVNHMNARQAFDLILQSQSLVRLQQGSVWFIVPRQVLIQEKQDEKKQQEILADTAPLVTRVWLIRYARAENIAHLIQDGSHSLLSRRGFLQMDVRTNQICVRDISENLSVIEKMIHSLDIPVKQVLIEARLASVDSDFERELGIHFSVQSEGMVSPEAGHYALAVATLADGSLLDVQLAALENEGHAELISSPSLFTANQQPASIESGEEIPYQEVSRGGGTGVAFKKAVLSLKVTPQILPNDRVQLQLQVNQDRPSSHVVLGVPAITTREISSNVLAKNGQTIVLGGIFESGNEKTTERVPFLGNIPVLGWLFQSQKKMENKRELLIFITPRIEAG